MNSRIYLPLNSSQYDSLIVSHNEIDDIIFFLTAYNVISMYDPKIKENLIDMFDIINVMDLMEIE